MLRTRERTFSEYAEFSVAVAPTLGTTDVTATTPQMRKPDPSTAPPCARPPTASS